MPANINSIAYANEVPWHGMGTRMKDRFTSEEALKQGGLDWEVEKLEIKTTSSIEIPSHRAVVRTDNKEVLGVVGKGYQILQNRDAFSFFDEAIKDRSAIFETVGALGKGEKVWMLAKVEGSDFYVLGEDQVQPYLLLYHGHDGFTSVTGMFTPIRVVCQNTLKVALSSNTDKIRVKHTGNVQEKLKLAGAMLRMTGAMIDETKPIFKALANRSLSASESTQYIMKSLSSRSVIKTLEDESEQLKASVEKVEELVETGVGSGIRGVRGTAWGTYNAITEYIDHHRNPRGGQENRLGSIWFGQGSAVKQRAFVLGARLSGVKMEDMLIS